MVRSSYLDAVTLVLRYCAPSSMHTRAYVLGLSTGCSAQPLSGRPHFARPAFLVGQLMQVSYVMNFAAEMRPSANSLAAMSHSLAMHEPSSLRTAKRKARGGGSISTPLRFTWWESSPRVFQMHDLYTSCGMDAMCRARLRSASAACTKELRGGCTITKRCSRTRARA